MANLIANIFKGKPPLVGWFGKLPALGDFTGRELPLSLREHIHAWCSDGMGQLTQKYAQAWKATYQLAPVWHFAMNAHLWDIRPLLGCVAPSIDSIGRCSPVLALSSIDAPRIKDHLPPRSRWLYEVEALLRHTIRGERSVDTIQPELQAALAADRAQTLKGDLTGLGIAANVNPNWFSWPDLAECFGERKKRSFWWAEPSPRQPPRQFIHNGMPDEELFELLFTGWTETHSASTGHTPAPGNASV